MTDQAVPLTLNWEYASRTGLVALAIAKELRRLAFKGTCLELVFDSTTPQKLQHELVHGDIPSN